MAHVRESGRSPRPQAAVFAYLSDFTTTAEWDPGVKDAEQLTDWPVEEGCRVSYDANLRLTGPLRLADPLLALVFHRIADRAIGGLRKAVGAHAER